MVSSVTQGNGKRVLKESTDYIKIWLCLSWKLQIRERLLRKMFYKVKEFIWLSFQSLEEKLSTFAKTDICIPLSSQVGKQYYL